VGAFALLTDLHNSLIVSHAKQHRRCVCVCVCTSSRHNWFFVIYMCWENV